MLIYVNVNFILRSFILVFALFWNKMTMRDRAGVPCVWDFLFVTRYCVIAPCLCDHCCVLGSVVRDSKNDRWTTGKTSWASVPDSITASSKKYNTSRTLWTHLPQHHCTLNIILNRILLPHEFKWSALAVHTPVSSNIKNTCLIWFRSPFAIKTALTCQGMDSSRPLKVCYCIWQQRLAADSLSAVSCEVEPPWIRLVYAAHLRDTRSDVLHPFLNNLCSAAGSIILLK